MAAGTKSWTWRRSISSASGSPPRVLAVIAGGAGTGTTECPWQYLEGSVFTAKGTAAILDDPSLAVFQIRVETYRMSSS
jgi:hypothetical protein